MPPDCLRIEDVPCQFLVQFSVCRHKQMPSPIAAAIQRASSNVGDWTFSNRPNTFFSSAQNFSHHLTGNVRQPKIAAVVAVDQPFMVDPQEVKDCGM